MMTNLIVAATNWTAGVMMNWMAATNGLSAGMSVWAEDITETRLQAGGRLTAIVETVCVVTNVTTWSNESGCRMCSEAGPGFTPAVYHPQGFVPCAPYKPATEKTETTEIIEVKTLRVKWDGEDQASERRRVLSRNVRRWVRKEAWEEAQ